ncbi:hypothetical protein ABZ370_08380 [Streptomyces sp. NPDC005962]|uniref:hypothetical protein n=1 Tax=Streptomyces sp. NPDC005962 TaxID=3154466 RepID=UPI0033EDF83A
MTQLPRAYWCHADYLGPSAGRGVAEDRTTAFPGHAITWMRQAVREVTPHLEAEPFAVAWAWLGNHERAGTAVHDLRSGRPYAFEVRTPNARWKWTAHLVSVLPVVETTTTNPGTHRRG